MPKALDLTGRRFGRLRCAILRACAARSPSRRALCPASKALMLAINEWHTSNAAEARNIAMAVLEAIERGDIPNVVKETP